MSTLHAHIHMGLITLTYSIKEEVSSINGSPRDQMGKSGEAAEGLCVQHKAPKDRTKGQQGAPQPSCAPHLSPGLQGQDAVPSPSAVATELGAHLLAGYPQAPSSVGTISAQRDSPGTGYGEEEGTRVIPRQGGLKRRTKSNAGPTAQLLTLFKICPHSGRCKICSFPPKLLWLHRRAPHQTSCSLLLQPCLVRRVLQLVTMCRIKKRCQKQEVFHRDGKAVEQLGKVSLGNEEGLLQTLW